MKSIKKYYNLILILTIAYPLMMMRNTVLSNSFPRKYRFLKTTDDK